MARKISELRRWETALFSGRRVTLSGQPLTDDQLNHLHMDGAVLVDADSPSDDVVRLVFVDEGDPLSDGKFRKELYAGLERIGA